MSKFKYVIKKRKDGYHGDTYWKEVGVLVMNDEDDDGVLYLHMFDGEFRVFPKDYNHES